MNGGITSPRWRQFNQGIEETLLILAFDWRRNEGLVVVNSGSLSRSTLIGSELLRINPHTLLHTPSPQKCRYTKAATQPMGAPEVEPPRYSHINPITLK